MYFHLYSLSYCYSKSLYLLCINSNGGNTFVFGFYLYKFYTGMVYKCKQVDSEDNYFRSLVNALDAELAIYNGEKDEFYTQINSIQYIKLSLIHI